MAYDDQTWKEASQVLVVSEDIVVVVMLAVSFLKWGYGGKTRIPTKSGNATTSGSKVVYRKGAPTSKRPKTFVTGQEKIK